MSDIDVSRAIGRLEGKLSGMENTQEKILVELQNLSKFNAELYSRNGKNAENIEALKKITTKTDAKVDSLQTSKNKALGFIGGISLASGGVGAALTKFLGGGGT